MARINEKEESKKEPKQQQIIVEREINLSVLNEKLNLIINALQKIEPGVFDDDNK